MAAAPPRADAPAHEVDNAVLFEAVGGPLGFELELRALLPGLRDRYEVGADAPLLDDLIRDALVVEPEVARRFVERRVEDGVLNGRVRHGCVGRTISLTKVGSVGSVAWVRLGCCRKGPPAGVATVHVDGRP
jgi:hypothetical protein